MSGPILMDSVIQEKAVAQHDDLQAGSMLHLYTNNYDPAYDAAPTDFTAPTFTGYAPVDLTGEWTDVSKQEDGVWYFQVGPFDFPNPPAGEGPVTVYGFWVELDGEVYAAGLFPAPFVMDTGGFVLNLFVVYKEYDKQALLLIVGP